MFLTAYNLPHYLVNNGLISAASVVDGDFRLIETGRRNRNFKVLRGSQPGLFVKQIKSTEQQAIATISREAAFYRAVHSDARYSALRELIPPFIDDDPRRHALTVGLAEKSESLIEKQLREGVFPEDTAGSLGRALGQIHAHGATFAADPSMRETFTYQLPWPLMLDQTGLQFLANTAPVGPALQVALQGAPALVARLSALRPYWQFDSLIHNDMKWDNCLVRQTESGAQELTLVDWELADIGDGAWDVASILKEYVVATFLHHASPQLKPVTLEAVRPSVRAFWSAYAGSRGPVQGMLDRAMLLIPARMVIAVLEYCQTQTELGALGTMIFEAAGNILNAPQVAQAQLFGGEV